MVNYSEDKKYAFFNGLKFTKDEKTGYYLNSTTGERLHRYVWKIDNGEIPSGYHIHHKDYDKGNNNINNLILTVRGKHLKEHGQNRAINDLEWLEKFNKKGIEAAKKWHASPEGREWHKKHYAKNKSKLHIKEVFVCEFCNEKFEAMKTGKNRFCSNSCKSAWRRKEGLDDETRTCEYCGIEYTSNRYAKTKTCSKTCSNRLNPRLPQLRNNKKH